MTVHEYGQAYKSGFTKTVRFFQSKGHPFDYAEEVAQYSWGRCFEHIGNIREPSKVMAYVIQTGIYHIISDSRRKRSEEKKMRNYADVLDAKRRLPEPVLSEIIDLWPPNRKRVLIMYLYGYSNKEIADVLRENPVTVRVQMLRDRVMIKEQLSKKC